MRWVALCSLFPTLVSPFVLVHARSHALLTEMLQDTELWSVLEVSYHARSRPSPIALPHGEARSMLCRLGRPSVNDLLTDV